MGKLEAYRPQFIYFLESHDVVVHVDIRLLIAQVSGGGLTPVFELTDALQTFMNFLIKI